MDIIKGQRIFQLVNKICDEEDKTLKEVLIEMLRDLQYEYYKDKVLKEQKIVYTYSISSERWNRWNANLYKSKAHVYKNCFIIHSMFNYYVIDIKTLEKLKIFNTEEEAKKYIDKRNRKQWVYRKIKSLFYKGEV